MKTKSAIAHFDDNGRRICFWIRRRGSQAVLFLHGLGCSKECFASAFEPGALPEDWTLLAPDLLGHGASAKPAEDSYELEELGRQIAALVREHGFTRVSIVGHSMGGAVGLLAADALPEVESFFCLEGNLIAEDCTLARRIASVAEDHFIVRLYPLAPLTFRCRGLPSDPPASPVALYRCSRSLLAWSESGSLLHRFLQFDGAKTYIYGARNDNVPVLSRLHDVDLVPIADCGHFMMVDQARRTYAEICKRLP